MPRYNPYILGFVDQSERFGEVWMPLQQALQLHGDLPSRYGLLSRQKQRLEKRVLNLQLGLSINRVLAQVPDLKRQIAGFFADWHRDWKAEFGVDTGPLFNRAEPEMVSRWIKNHHVQLVDQERIDVRAFLNQQALIRRDTLNSIPDSELLPKGIEILIRKRDQASRGGGTLNPQLVEAVARLQVKSVLTSLESRLGLAASQIDPGLAAIYADEIMQAISAVDSYLGSRPGIRYQQDRKGIHFSFAGRDQDILTLGSAIGDCTAKPFKQIDTHTENIYWTVFPWLLDRNYLILKVHYQEHLVAKVHLLPLVTYESEGMKLFLAVDAIETAVIMRHDIAGENRLPEDLCREIFSAMQQEIIRIADAAGFEDVYAELFSNNRLVREWLESFEKVYMDVSKLHKVDELEDLFLFARQLSRDFHQPAPGHIFMELQFRNTQLMSHQTPRTHMKGFASLRRGRLSGHAMSKVIGI